MAREKSRCMRTRVASLDVHEGKDWELSSYNIIVGRMEQFWSYDIFLM